MCALNEFSSIIGKGFLASKLHQFYYDWKVVAQWFRATDRKADFKSQHNQAAIVEYVSKTLNPKLHCRILSQL